MQDSHITKDLGERVDLWEKIRKNVKAYSSYEFI